MTTQDGGAEGGGPVAPATCDSACSHWRGLGCPEGDGTPAGASCEQVCANVQDSGITTWDLDCLAAVASCTEIDAC